MFADDDVCLLASIRNMRVHLSLHRALSDAKVRARATRLQHGFYGHGKSVVPEEQACPAVSTVNVTLAWSLL